MGFFRRRPVDTDIQPEPIPVPRSSIDGWTLAGTPLATKLNERMQRQDLRELETLLHGIAIHADTPYTYERAAVLLERADERGAALSVCEAWLDHPAAQWPEYLHQTRAIEKRRTRVRARIVSVGSPQAAAPAAS